MRRTNDQQRPQTGIGILSGRGENLTTHGRLDNKPSLATVCQKDANGLPNTAKHQVNAIFTKMCGKSVGTRKTSTRDFYRDCSETVPRPFRDQWQTIGRLDPQNQT
jgi:hypothetical protein